LALSRLALAPPEGLGLDSKKPTWTLHFHSAWPVGFVPGFVPISVKDIWVKNARARYAAKKSRKV
jgi:hypothetical protein